MYTLLVRLEYKWVPNMCTDIYLLIANLVQFVQLPLSSRTVFLSVLSIFIVALLQFAVRHVHIMLLSVCEIRAMLQFFVLAEETSHSAMYGECRQTA